MWEHELTYKFNPTIEFEDIPKVEAFINYLQSLISISREKHVKDELQRTVRSKLIRKKTKKKDIINEES
jgi:hypothetical protein